MTGQQSERQTEAARFLTALFSGYWPDPDLRLEIRCLQPDTTSDDQRSGHPPRCWYPLDASGLERAAADSVRLAARWNVFPGVLPRTGERGKSENVDYAGYLWADADAGDQTTQDAFNLIARADVPAPHIAVLSGRGCHAYWRLSQPVTLTGESDRKSFKELLKRLVRAIGGTAPAAHADSARADIASVMRVPGTINHKAGQKRPVRLVHYKPDQECRSLLWWRSHLPALPAPAPVERRFNPRWGVSTDPHPDPQRIPRWVAEWMQTPVPPGARHRDLTKVAAVLGKDYRFPRDQIEEILMRKAAVCGVPSSEVRDIVRWAV